MRQSGLHRLQEGDAGKARHLGSWRSKVTMQQLCRMMIDADMELAQQERTLVDAGYDLRGKGIEIPQLSV